MENENRSFRLSIRRLIPFVLFYAMATVDGLRGLFAFDMLAFEDMLLQMEIVTPSVVQGSCVVFGVIALMMVLWPGALAVSMILVLLKRPGFSGLSKVLDISSKAVKILRYVFIGYFVFRVIRYTILCLREDLVVYLLMAMFLYEGLFGVAFYFFLQLLMKFFSNAADTLASLQYVLYSGKPEYSAGHISVVRMLIFLSIPGIALAIYLILYPFVGVPCAVSLIVTAIANIFLGIRLKRCESKISYAAYRLKKEQTQLDL